MNNTIATSLLTTTFVLGIVQVIALLKAQKCKRQANAIMAAFLITGILIAFDCYMVFTQSYYDFPHLIKVLTPFNLLFGILPYCYSRSLTREEEKPKYNYFKHLIPVLLLFAAYSPVYFLSAEEKIRHLAENQNFLLRKIIMIYILISNSIYMIRGYLNTLNYQRLVKETENQIDQLKAHWLKQLLFVLLLIHFCVVLISFLFANQSFQVPYIALFVGIFIINLFSGYVAIRQIGPLLALVNNGGQQVPPSQAGKVREKLRKIPEKTQKEAALALAKAINEQKVFLDGDLNLDLLAKKIGYPSYVVSYVLNSEYQMTFFELINSLRIKEASIRLKQEEFSHLTIIAIAEDVGFNSKSTFNTAFKKHFGTTPSQFRSTKS